MEYNFRDIEKKWQSHWQQHNAYRVSNDSNKPKYYVLDMFPYPSGAGLHVGHPLGYIASDIYSRYKRLKGFNVLHPMGYDAFGLPAEQYAIDHGVHPAVSTCKNIDTFRKQLDNIGFCYDWEREVRTCEPGYYKWTQWIFLQLFNSFFNRATQKAEPIVALIQTFETNGTTTHAMPNRQHAHATFTAADWQGFDEATKQDILMQYRLAFCGFGEVNWCEALGTVLANDEVVNGVSERGGHPVVKKKLRQWYLRITEYADRLLEGLERVDFSESMKEMQTNWIGKSSGAEIDFAIGLTPGPSPGGEGSVVDEAAGTSGNYFKTADKGYWHVLKEYGRENRKNQTEAEDTLWQFVRNNQLGVKVRRQHAIAGYIVDFAMLEVRLAIEVDGPYHSEAEQKQFDEARTAHLGENGISVIRFTNEEILTNTRAVVEEIKNHIATQRATGATNKAPLLCEEKGVGDEATLRIYTTRPDTIFGVDFMVVAPEHELVSRITTAEQKLAVEDYVAYVNSRSERERMAEKKITGCFTGAYAINPFDGRQIPIWISEYVLAGYGTGAIMAVPCGDERDHKFAQHFNISISNIIGAHYNGEEANPTKDAVLENSGFLNGLEMRQAIGVAIDAIEQKGIGTRKVNYKMRDAAFSRQRYWGEPFPITWKNGVAYPLPETELPLTLPQVDSYSPGPEGEGPLANIPEWVAKELETNTMPGYAGSSWYFLRYMDPQNDKEFCNRAVSDYWNQVDLYIGGTEHAVGHLLYSRMWTKALCDLGHIGFDEPFKRLVNQGMIQGSSRFVYRVRGTNEFVSAGLKDQYETDEIHVDVNIVDGVELDVEAFKKWREEYQNATFILEDGKYHCGSLTEKMSKRLYNTVNPDTVVEKYGADTFRMYEMFLGPVEMSKPWDTKGIEGVHRFLKKLWRLFYHEEKGALFNNDAPADAEYKTLHRTIKKIEDDTERFSFNTAVAAFMVCVNELTEQKCHKKEILEQLVILLTPYAPHVAEELYQVLTGGAAGSVLDAQYPRFEPKYLVESSKEYPVSINGKVRTNLNIALDAAQADVEALVLANETVQKWLDGKPHKKIIFVKGKMINIVV
jgi:leucyl-tRNA synthetase